MQARRSIFMMKLLQDTSRKRCLSGITQATCLINGYYRFAQKAKIQPAGPPQLHLASSISFRDVQACSYQGDRSAPQSIQPARRDIIYRCCRHIFLAVKPCYILFCTLHAMVDCHDAKAANVERRHLSARLSDAFMCAARRLSLRDIVFRRRRMPRPVTPPAAATSQTLKPKTTAVIAMQMRARVLLATS